MNCLIVDDEQLARQLVQSYAERIPSLQISAICKNGIEALEVLKKVKIDLIITDIQMPGLLGTEFIKSIPQKPKVIFTTAYKDYAIEGFELEAVDYLLKPFTFERFLKAINKADDFQNTTQEPLAQSTDSFMTIKADHKLYKVRLADIIYVEGMREYVSFYLPDQRITALMSLKSLEEILPANQFIRCHKSFIVNKTKVEALESGNLMIGEKAIPIGQSYKDLVIHDIF